MQFNNKAKMTDNEKLETVSAYTYVTHVTPFLQHSRLLHSQDLSFNARVPYIRSDINTLNVRILNSKLLIA